MNIDKLKADLEKLNKQKQQAENRARDLQARIQKADRAQQTKRNIILGAWCAGMIEKNPSVRESLRAYIQDKDKGLFPDLFKPEEIEAAKTRVETTKAERVKHASSKASYSTHP